MLDGGIAAFLGKVRSYVPWFAVVRGEGVDAPLVGVGLYSVPEAARIASYAAKFSLKADTVRRWTKGYSFRREDRENFSESIISSAIDLDGAYVLSFSELVELLYITAFRREGLSMRLIRAIHDHAKIALNCQHPFATRKFYTDGKNILWELTQDDVDTTLERDHLIEDIRSKHIVLEEVVKPFFRKLDYIEEIASAFWPLGRERSIMISPQFSFGRSVESASGVPTEAIFSAFKAGETLDSIADWFEMSIQGVRDALEYERGLRSPLNQAA